MGKAPVPAVIEIYLCQPDGTRIECLDYVTEYDYTLIANDTGTFRIKLPAKFNRKNIRLDNIIEIWRGFEPGTLKCEFTGFIRGWVFSDEAGVESTELYGYSLMELLKRRIVKDYAGSAQAKMTNEADDMIKAIVKDQLGADTTAARDLTSVGGGFSIQSDLADGESLTKEFAYKTVLEICQEVADASKQAGTEVYFDIVPVYTSVTTGMIAFQLQTFTDQRGNDRTWDSNTPVYVGIDWGNLENGSLEYDYTEEVNYVYALGQGEGVKRETSETSDTARIGLSIWNLREGAKDARQVDIGDTAALAGEANTYLNEKRPKIKFTGDIIETPAFRYARDWWFGDRVTLVYANLEMDAMISKVKVGRGDDGQETITARIEIGDVIAATGGVV